MSFFIWVWVSNSLHSRSLFSATVFLRTAISSFRASVSPCWQNARKEEMNEQANKPAKDQKVHIYSRSYIIREKDDTSDLSRYITSLFYSSPLPPALCFHVGPPNLPSAPLSSVSASSPKLSSPPASCGPPSGSLHAKQRPCDPPSCFCKRCNVPVLCERSPPPRLYKAAALCFHLWRMCIDHKGAGNATAGAPGRPPASGFPSASISAPALSPRLSSPHLSDLPGKV